MATDPTTHRRPEGIVSEYTEIVRFPFREHHDSPGDDAALCVEAAMRHDRDGIFIDTDGADSGWMSAPAARQFGEWLIKRYGLSAWVPAVGDTVKILPGATRNDGDEVDSTATRAQILDATPDSDGDVSIALLDGDDAGEEYYVLPKFLVHGDAILPEAPAAMEAASEVDTLAAMIRRIGAVNSRDAESLAATLISEGVHLPPTATPAPFVPEAGGEYRLLPDAQRRGGQWPFAPEHNVTRVRVERGPDRDGDFYIRAMDGTPGYRYGYVLPTGLAPLADAGPWVPGDMAIVTVDRPFGAQLFTGDRVRIVRRSGQTVDVRFLSGRGNDRQTWYLTVAELRRP